MVSAFTSVCSSINLVFNGTSLSLNRTNLFWRDWMRTQVSSEDAARIYRCCGGAYDAEDQLGVTIDTAGANAVRAVADQAAGLACDSAIAERCKALYSQLTPEYADGVAGEQPGERAGRYIIVVARIRAPRHFALQRVPHGDSALFGGRPRLSV